jgi:hypothetical protein
MMAPKSIKANNCKGGKMEGKRMDDVVGKTNPITPAVQTGSSRSLRVARKLKASDIHEINALRMTLYYSKASTARFKRDVDKAVRKLKETINGPLV